MISYAQDLEDVRLARVFPETFDGFYVDVGANDPVELSVTKHFADHGWRGINIEPNPAQYERLRAARPRDVNVNVGLSNREGRLLFHECPAVHGWSTFSPELAAHYRRQGLVLRTYEVPVTTLAEVCLRHVNGPIDFLKLDVEGLEREVVEGADWSRWRPKVVLVEDAQHERWESLILAAGYVLSTCTSMNRYYVRSEDRHLAEVLAEPVGFPRDDFLSHGVAQIVRQINDRLARGEPFTETTLRVACRLHQMAASHPRLARVCRALLRTAG
jgi:FkbM family methyltransferase